MQFEKMGKSKKNKNSKHKKAHSTHGKKKSPSKTSSPQVAKTPSTEAQKAPLAQNQSVPYKKSDTPASTYNSTRIFRQPDGEIDKKSIILLVVLIVAILALIIVLFLMLFSPNRPPENVYDASVSTSQAQFTLTDDSYDQEANSLPTELLQGTILSETDDMGVEYVEETLFLGDSNTVRLSEFGEEDGLSLQNGFGVVGQTIEGAIYNYNIRFAGLSNVTMADSVAIVQPRRVVITFGTNNVGYTSAESFVESYKEFLDLIDDSYSYADIIIASVPPITPNPSSRSLSQSEIDLYNLQLAELAEEEGYKFLNWSEALKDEDSGFAKEEYMESDGYHITQEACDVMLEYFRTHSYVTEDTRPKPLDPVPQHYQTPAPVTSTSQSQEPAESTVAPVAPSVPTSTAAPVPTSVPPVSTVPTSVPAPVDSTAAEQAAAEQAAAEQAAAEQAAADAAAQAAQQ